jgi:crotonobetainyl-CoA:carnitine CoA-transferase CaiB-like acyl-CoA transferase
LEVTYLLEGLKVIDLASFLAAPGAATLMADYGAEVIKIEPPGGDGYRRLHGNWKTDYNWQLTSRNKLGMSLDRKRRGYDSTAWFARTGIMQLMKPKDAPPVFPAGGVGDHSTAMSLFAGVMMALFKREKEGEGSFVETSLIASGCWANGMSLQGAISGFDLGGFLDKSNRSPFAMVYETRDRRFVILVFTNPPKEWPEFANALGHPEWLEDERFQDMRTLMRHRDDLKEIIAEAIGAMNLKDVSLALDKFELTFGVIDGLTDVVQDAHLIENGVVIKTESDDPEFEWTIANPIKISGEACKPAIDPPLYGEHSRKILLDHGFTEKEIESLIRDKVVFAGES